MAQMQSMKALRNIDRVNSVSLIMASNIHFSVQKVGRKQLQQTSRNMVSLIIFKMQNVQKNTHILLTTLNTTQCLLEI